MSTLRVDTIYFPRPSMPQPAAENWAAVAPPPPSFDPVDAVAAQTQMRQVRSRVPAVLEDRHRAMAQLMEWSALFAHPVLPTLVVAAVTEQGSVRPWRARDPGYAMYTMAALNPATMTVLLNSYFPTYRPRRR